MKEKKFAFLVHPRGFEDFLIKFPWFRFLPESVLYFLTMHMPPVVVSKITGLKNKDGKKIDGYIIAITMTARQMIEHRERALKKIKQATKLAEKKGVRLMGLGALTASFSRGGLDLAGFSKVGITTGRAYTVKTVTNYVKLVMEVMGFDKEKIVVDVVGAAGSIGSSSAKVLAEYGIRNFILIDLEYKAWKVEEYIKHMKKIRGDLSFKVSHQISDIKDADIIIAATNAPEVLIKPDDLKSGAIIINDAQPSDVDPEVLKREDVLVVEGGVVNTPGIRSNFKLGLHDKEDNFCCMGEVLILAHNNLFKDYALGELNLSLIKNIEMMSENLNFKLTKTQNSNGIIDNKKIERVKEIIRNRQ